MLNTSCSGLLAQKITCIKTLAKKRGSQESTWELRKGDSLWRQGWRLARHTRTLVHWMSRYILKCVIYTGKFHVHMYVCVINIHTHIDIIYSIYIDYSYSGVELARHGGPVTSPIFYPVSPSAPLTSHTEKSFWVSEGLKPMPALPSWGLSLFQISPSYSLMTPSSPIDYFS